MKIYEYHQLKTKPVGILLNLIEQIAKDEFDGHYSVFSFTTNYRVGFGTITNSWQFQSVLAHETLHESLIQAILLKPVWK